MKSASKDPQRGSPFVERFGPETSDVLWSRGASADQADIPTGITKPSSSYNLSSQTFQPPPDTQTQFLSRTIIASHREEPHEIYLFILLNSTRASSLGLHSLSKLADLRRNLLNASPSLVIGCGFQALSYRQLLIF